MKTQKPLILISSLREPSPLGGKLTRDAVESSYVNAILTSGGIPLLVPFGVSKDDVKELAREADGLLIPGGVDIDPKLYGEEKISEVENISPERDALELLLVKTFFETNKPVFGICRGAQMMNIALGGKLYQDLESQLGTSLKHWIDPNEDKAFRYEQDIHPINIEKGSVLARYFGATEATVNSLHHQAIKSVVDGVRVGAKAEDGVIEEVESSDMKKRWLLGVQWHPEALIKHHPENKTLFEHFIEAAQKNRKSKRCFLTFWS